jgi:putative ABC transport system substrate-binding protein
MRRRQFIAGLGSTAAWPVLSHAQQLPVIGYLGSGSPNTTVALAPFLQGLRETGFIEGLNVAIEYRWADGDFDRLPGLAADLVKRRVAVIHASGGRAPAIAAKAATSTIPIVFQGDGDPVDDGLVTSLNRPGGNVTGAMNLGGGPLNAKAVQYLRELVPNAASLGLLVNDKGPNNHASAEAAARELQWDFQIFIANTDDELKAVFEEMARRQIGALNVVGHPAFTARRSLIVALAAQFAIPASYGLREFVLVGGLMSYGPDIREPNRVAGNYVGRVLKGDKPADLPVQQPTKIILAINLKTAKALRLTFPLTLLATADEVIE